MAASGRATATAAVAAVFLVLLLSSAMEQAAAQVPCSKCDDACKKSCKGYGRDTDCSAPCSDPSNKAGCEGCLDAYYSKCLNYCGQSCRVTCTSG
uniref:Kazal-like domain-containing protein n=1 Tax=Leersia perrieri TaxID=77586 RepID=A0A0D9VXV0_9ORYZ